MPRGRHATPNRSVNHDAQQILTIALVHLMGSKALISSID